MGDKEKGLMHVPFVDLKAQYQGIRQEIDEAIRSVISDCAFIGGKYVTTFEEEFARYCGSKYCVGVGNGTDALHIALRALGVEADDEVITVANSFIATAEAITMTGARVVFVDCEPQTFNIDIAKVEEAISTHTKAIVPVHLYGQPSDMSALKELAQRHDLFLVEDAAQAHGAEIGGKRVGTFGHAGCFSFYPGKNLGAYGDAGAIVSDDYEFAVRARMIANHGRVKKYEHEFEGVNSRLDGLQGAILSVKLKHIDEWTEKRRAVAALYGVLLEGTDITTPKEASNRRHVYHLYVVRVSNRDKVQDKLKERGIATGIHYPIALPDLEAYKYLGYSADNFPVATRCSREILSLPMFPELDEHQVTYVCEQLKEVRSEGM
jgi:dTDP-4-amino-4,6-dideoxygalactose transaminase